MKWALCALIIGLLDLASAPSVYSQITYDGCVDFRGIPVASVRLQHLGDVAQARFGNDGSPVIYYDPEVLAWLHPQTRLFFYAHECGHHVLGHLAQSPRPGTEQEADCWAINVLYADGFIDDDDVAIIQGDINRFGRGDWTHLPGRMRAINLRRCLGQ